MTTLEEHDLGQTHAELFQLLVESVKDYAIFLLDTTGHIRSWNEGARRIKGYTPDEIIGKHFSTFYPPEAVSRGKPANGLRIAAAEGRWEEEGWRIRKGGEPFWASVVITALHDQGELVGFAKVTRDLTERKRAEDERIHLIEREQEARRDAEVAEATLKARDEFLSVAAHELKTPLTSLRLAAQTVMRRLDEGRPLDLASLQRSLRTIDRQTDRLTRLVTQLLETVRAQAGKLQRDDQRTDLAELVREAAENNRPYVGTHEVRLRIPDSLWVTLDPFRIEQVVVNLLDNAVKFSPNGGEIDVELEQQSSGMVRLAVRDRGIGVPPEQRAHLFERFYRAHGSDHRSGMGLGLYICREIVELHGGQIRAEFPPDGGTQMVVELPGS